MSAAGHLGATAVLLIAVAFDGLYEPPAGDLPQIAVLVGAAAVNLMAAGVATGRVETRAAFIRPAAVIANTTLMVPTSLLGGLHSVPGIVLAGLIAVQLSGLWTQPAHDAGSQRVVETPLSLLGWGTRLIGSVAAAAAAIAWLWLIVDPESAGRAGDLSLFGSLYAALGIAANLAASATYARIRVEVDGLAWGLTLVAGVATVTLFSQESPIGRLSPTAATVLLVLVVLQGAALLLLQRPSIGS